MDIGKKFNATVHLAGRKIVQAKVGLEVFVQGLSGSIDAGKSEKRAFYYNTRKKGKMFFQYLQYGKCKLYEYKTLIFMVGFLLRLGIFIYKTKFIIF